MYHLLANTFLASGRKGLFQHEFWRLLSFWRSYNSPNKLQRSQATEPSPKINPCIVSQSLPIENDAHFIWIYPARQLKTRLLVVQKKMSKARWLAIVRPENQFLRTNSPTTTLINNKISHQIRSAQNHKGSNELQLDPLLNCAMEKWVAGQVHRAPRGLGHLWGNYPPVPRGVWQTTNNRNRSLKPTWS